MKCYLYLPQATIKYAVFLDKLLVRASLREMINREVKKNNYHIYFFLIKFHAPMKKVWEGIIPSFILKEVYLTLLGENKKGKKVSYFCLSS